VSKNHFPGAPICLRLRESLHVSDGSGRICVVETKTVDGGFAVGGPTGIWRYQLSNHLGLKFRPYAASESPDIGR
jgi:hypothetical protein